MYTDRENFLKGSQNLLFVGGQSVITRQAVQQAIDSSGCEYIDTIIVKDDVDEIANDAFRAMSRLKRVHLGENVREIGDRSFANCIQLELISGEWGNVSTLPRFLHSIGDCAFSGTAIKHWKNNAFSASNIGNAVFSDSEIVTAPNFKYMNSFGVAAFKACKKLTKVVIPDNIVFIESECFAESSVDTVVFDNQLFLRVAASAFRDTDVKKVTFNTKGIINIADWKPFENATIYCYKDSYAYKEAKKHCKEINIIT